MKNRTHSIFSMGRVSAKKVVSVLMAITMCVCLFVPMTPAGALSATTGNKGQNATIYSPLDMLPTDDLGALKTETFNVDQSDVWQFGVEKQVSTDFDVLYNLIDHDFFAPTVDDFAAPVVTATGKGTEVTVSWTALETAPEYYMVKFVDTSADAENVTDLKDITLEYKVPGNMNTITVADLKENANYYVQVAAGNKGSALSEYGSGSVEGVKRLPAKVNGIELNDGGGGVLTQTAKYEKGAGGLYWQADFSDAIDYFTPTGALLLKFEVDIDPEMIKDITVGEETFSTKDIALGANFYIEATKAEYDQENMKYIYPVDRAQTANLQATKDKVIFADENLKPIASGSTAGSGANAMGNTHGVWKTVGFTKDFYMVVPLSAISSTFMSRIQKQDMRMQFSFSSLRYYYNGGSELSGEVLGWSHNRNMDRAVTFASCEVLQDYALFCKENKLIEENNTVIKASDELVPAVTSSSIIYSKNGWNSTYVFTPYVETGDRWHQTISTRIGIIWKAAKGEKMKFGFKAPADGVYEFAAPIEADLDAAVAYAVSKVSPDGSKVYVQGWNTDYVGKGLTVTDRSGKTYPDQLCDIQVELKAGDILYLEAFSNQSGANINIGVPSARKLDVKVDEETQAESYIYKLSDYIHHTKTEDGKYVSVNKNRSTAPQFDAAWEMGYYANKISETNDLSALTQEILDPNGVASMKAGDDFSNIGDLMQKHVKMNTRDKTNIDYFAWDVGMTVSNVNNDNRVGAGDGFPGSVMIGGKRAATSYAEDTAGIRMSLGYQPYQTWSMYEDHAGKDTKGTYNVSALLKYTAPTTGSAKLRLDNAAGLSSSGQLHNAGFWAKALVVHNGVVVGNYAKLRDLVIELELEQGDEIHILYYVNWEQGKLSTTGGSSRFQVIGNPYVEIAKDKEYVEFITDGGYAVDGFNFVNAAVNEENPLVLPELKKAAAVFRGWSNGEEILEAGTEITSKVTLTAVWAHYGDFDGNKAIGDDADISGMSAAILVGENADIADLNGDGEVDLLDLMRLRRYSCGLAAIAD